MGLSEKFENAKDNAIGNARQAIGKVTDNEKLEAEGRLQEAKGDVGAAKEKAVDNLEDARDKAKDALDH